MRLFGRNDQEMFTLFSEERPVGSTGRRYSSHVVEDYNDLDVKMAKLTAMEHEGDRIIQELVLRLNTSFYSPFLTRKNAISVCSKNFRLLWTISPVLSTGCYCIKPASLMTCVENGQCTL
jgi:uncharacterized protein Yka (UPF0111/DUF47 family)